MGSSSKCACNKTACDMMWITFNEEWCDVWFESKFEN